MLTAAQKARCATLAEALDARDQGPWLKAEPSLTVEEKGAIWSMRRHVVAFGQREAAARPAGIPVEATSRTVDLDYWASDDEPPIDDEVLDGEPECSACRGTGKGPDGRACPICNGRGTIPGEDQPDDGDEDDFENKSLRYEYEE